MRVEVSPTRLEGMAGMSHTVTITITNTGDLIGGYAVRVLGADPEWVSLDNQAMSIFPEASTVVVATIRVPDGLVSGTRRIGIQVRELTPPESVTVEEIDLEIAPAPRMTLSLDPVTVSGGSTQATSLSVENTGNTTVSGRFTAVDPEDGVAFTFRPERIKLAPGERMSADLDLRARRPWFGNPAIRTFELGFEQSDAFTAFTGADGSLRSGPAGPRSGSGAAGEAAGPPPFMVEPIAQGVFLQRPRLARIAVSLLTLLGAVTVFAVIITIVLSQVVSQSTADRQLALAVAQARDSGGTGGSSSISGKVSLLTSGAGVSDVAVQLFAASDTATAVATATTGDDGSYALPSLAPGSYKVAFFGAGFAELWYPASLTDADAMSLTLQPGQKQASVDVQLGGLPATISGLILGDDVSGARVQVALPIFSGTIPVGTVGPVGVDDPTGGAAIVRTVPVGADGTFLVSQIPSPSIYDLIVSKAGYATQVQRLDLSGGEERTGIEIRLQKGNGLISGRIVGQAGPLGGATITATSGTSVVRTISVTEGDTGSFTLRNLASPSTYTIVVSNPGFASSTSTLSLTNGQQLSGVSIVLGTSAGTLAGVVTNSPGGGPASGVTVSVSNGALTIQTVTQSSGTPGGWSVGGLAIPSTYTVTFSRLDLDSQTVSVSLDGFGNVTADTLSSAASNTQVNASLSSATATLYGVVFQSTDGALQSCSGSIGDPSAPQGEASVTLTSGSRTYSTTTATYPESGALASGQYILAGLRPGTYTISIAKPGRAPTTTTKTLAAGDNLPCNIAIARPSSIAGRIVTAGSPAVGVQLVLYKAELYPVTAYRTATTDGAGTFLFSEADAPGSYVLEARSGTTVLASRTFELPASQVLNLGDIETGP
ncbi:MAG: carboxypeptidase regulatory-like protein [Pseudonocardiales bacterium]|nr:carboxypeptidase regulatory-like protein [Pseudonocardiales bacterium]